MKLKLLLSIFTIGILLSPSILAQKVEAKRGVVDDAYNFWFYKPDSASVEKPKPLVIFLHGASLCGNDLNKVRRYGTIDAIERGRKIDAYVIAPQNPGGAWDPHKIMHIVEWVEVNHHVDASRVYVLGMSLGGYGTLDLVAAYPEYIAAAMAFCGGSTAPNLGDMNDVPLWIIHGTADRLVAVGESDRVVEGMKSYEEESDRMIYTRVPGMNHSEPARYFYMAETYDWLFTHNLEDEDRPVTEAFDIVGMSKNAYKNLNRKASTKAVKSKKSSKKKRKK